MDDHSTPEKDAKNARKRVEDEKTRVGEFEDPEEEKMEIRETYEAYMHRLNEGGPSHRLDEDEPSYKLDEDEPSDLKIAVEPGDPESNVERICRQAEPIRAGIKRKRSSESEDEVKDGPVAIMYQSKMMRPTAMQLIDIRPSIIEYGSSSPSGSDSSSDKSVIINLRPEETLRSSQRVYKGSKKNM